MQTTINVWKIYIGEVVSFGIEFGRKLKIDQGVKFDVNVNKTDNNVFF
jgi:hypothetical protein